MNHSLRRAGLALCFAFSISTGRISAAAADPTSDGPYLLHDGRSMRVAGLKGDSLIEEQVSDQVFGDDHPGPFPQFRYDGNAYPRTSSASWRQLRATTTIDTTTRILAVSDIHGDFDHLTAFLQRAGVVDSTLHWIWGDGRLVVVGDIFDRGAQVTECLWLLCKLQIDAWLAGGRVHVLLGNHELMVMRGDLRYVNEKYTNGIVKRTGISYSDLYGPDSELGRWLRSLNSVIRINDILFVHGGIAPWLTESGLSIDRINDSARAAIDLPKDSLAAHPFLRRLLGTDGPFWYRGYHYAMEDKYPVATTDEVDRMLAQFDADVCAVGHTEEDSLMTLLGGRVVAVDVPVDELGGFEGLLWENGLVYRVTSTGRRVPLELHTSLQPRPDEH